MAEGGDGKDRQRDLQNIHDMYSRYIIVYATLLITRSGPS